MGSYCRADMVRKSYGEVDAKQDVLRGVTFSLEQGEICAFLGPSGSGKSTFLNLLGGLERADSGTLSVGGAELTLMNARQLAEYRRNELGFVFQFYNLISDLTVKENIEVTARLAKNPLSVDDVLAQLGLWEHRNKFPNQISGGQQQRCAIGRAIVKTPRLLLCDEPTGALDYSTSLDILDVIEMVNREYGCTVIIVTHNEAISHMASRVLRLRDGKILSDTVNSERIAAKELVW